MKYMSGSNVTNNDVNNAANQRIAQITQDYQDAERYLTELHDAEGKKIQDEKTIEKYNSDKVVHKDLFGNKISGNVGAREHDRDKKAAGSAEHDLDIENDRIAEAEAGLKTIDSSSSMASFISTWNDLDQNAADLIFNSKGTNLDQNYDDINEYFDDLSQAMSKQLRSDKDQQILNEEGDHLSFSEAENYEMDMSSAQTGEQKILNNIYTKMDDDLVTYHDQYNSAYEHSKQYDATIFSLTFGQCDGNNHKDLDKAVMKDAERMISLISTLMTDLAPILGSLQPEFIQLNTTMKMIMLQLQQILSNPDLSSADSKAQLLALLMYALGLLDQTKETANSARSANEKIMSQGTLTASQISLKESIADQEVMQDLMGEQDLMKEVIKVTQIIMTVTFIVMAPGVGSALAMTVLALIDQFSDPVKLIAQTFGCSTVAAEAIWTSLEIVMTCGGGAMLDAGMSQGLKADAKILDEELAAEAEASLVAKAEQVAGPTGNVDAALEVLKQGRSSASQRAMEITGKQYTNQTFGAMAVDSLGSMGSKSFKGIEGAMKGAGERAGDDAMENPELLALAEKASRGEVLSETEKESIFTISNEIAIGTSAQMSGTTAEKLEAKLNQSALRVAASRGATTMVYGIGANNMLIDAYREYQRKHHKKDDELTIVILEVIQGLMQAALYRETPASFAGAANGWLKAAGAMDMSLILANAAANYSIYKTKKDESYLGELIANSTNNQSFLDDYNDSIQQTYSNETNGMMREISTSEGSTNYLALHSQDGVRKALQVPLRG